MTNEFLIAWLLLMFPLVYSPGPANTLFATNGARFGFFPSLPFMTGINVAFVLQSLLVGFGLSRVLEAYPQLLAAFRLLGIAYIAYLGTVFLRAAFVPSRERDSCLTFLDGMVVTSVNPKAWVMQLMMFSQFYAPDEPQSVGVWTLTLLLSGLNISGHVVWTSLGSLLIARAGQSISLRHQNLFFALMLYGSIWFLV